jgi:hypothetical protein
VSRLSLVVPHYQPLFLLSQIFTLELKKIRPVVEIHSLPTNGQLKLFLFSQRIQSFFDSVTFCEGERGSGRSAQLQRAYATAVEVCHASCPRRGGETAAAQLVLQARGVGGDI